jgi:mono/diheme cytochrome c family protein
MDSAEIRNQPMRRKALLVALVLSVIVSAIAFPPRGYSKVQGESGSLSPAEARKLKNPVPFTKESIVRGRTIFARYCTECHGTDGKAMVDVIANATDLTDPALWKNGTSEGETFRSIREGAGMSMPSFKTQIHKEEDLWHLVNFVRSLWPESVRPKLP